MLWWIVGLLVLCVVFLFQIAQRLRPVSAYFARRDDARRQKSGVPGDNRWEDFYEE